MKYTFVSIYIYHEKLVTCWLPSVDPKYQGQGHIHGRCCSYPVELLRM